MDKFKIGDLTDKGKIIDYVVTDSSIIWITDALEDNSWHEENLKLINHEITKDKSQSSKS